MNIETGKLLVAIIIPTIGWIVGYLIKQRLDFQNSKREKRIDFLLKSYLKLENCIQRKSNDYMLEIEQAVSEIQVLGNETQIKLIKKLAIEVADGKRGDMEPLLISLRDDLRKELNLKHSNEKIIYFRMN